MKLYTHAVHASVHAQSICDEQARQSNAAVDVLLPATARRHVAVHVPAATTGYGFDRACPQCGGTAYRIRRELLDRVVSLLIPVGRYRCPWIGCCWEGVLRTSPRA